MDISEAPPQHDALSRLSPQAAAFAAASHRNLIDGRWEEAREGGRLDVVDPGSGSLLGSVASSSAADIDDAVAAARRALEDGPWSRMTAAERGRLLWRLGDLLSADGEVFAELESLDTGRPIYECRMVDIPGSVGMLEYMAGWASKINGETMKVAHPGDFHVYTEREPVGVVAVIVPWNYPLELAVWRMAPALAAGCTLVLKPAEQTSLTAIRLGQRIGDAGFPPGVVNIVTGEGEATGAALAAHPGVDAISFTGSTKVGRSIIAASAGNMKRIFLELGGKSPSIIFGDADLERAIPGVAGAIFFSSGQVCTAGSRLFVEERIFDRVVEGVADIARSLRVGHGLDPATQLGPLVSETQLGRVVGHLDAARGKTRFLTGGARIERPGYFVEPTLVLDAAADLPIWRDEVFGPVLCARPFKADALDELASAANDSIYGLHASIWTTNLSTAHRFARRIKAGNVCINTHNFFDPAFPMGGFKQSGWGRAAGFPAIEHYTELKGIVAAL